MEWSVHVAVGTHMSLTLYVGCVVHVAVGTHVSLTLYVGCVVHVAVMGLNSIHISTCKSQTIGLPLHSNP
jgi:hypothetical protein